MGAPVTAAVKRTALLRWSWEGHFTAAATGVGRSLVTCLERIAGTDPVHRVGYRRAAGAFYPVRHRGRPCADLVGAAGAATSHRALPRCVAAARDPRTRGALSASERCSRILTVGRTIDDVIEWGWAEVPPRRLIFSKDISRLRWTLPRYLPPGRSGSAAHRKPSTPPRTGSAPTGCYCYCARPGVGSAN